MSAWPGGRRGARGAGDTLRIGEICIAAIIIFTVRGLPLSYRDFSYNGENRYVFSKKGP